MKFKKGTKVEVLSQKEAPYGSWRCAEIIDSNGHHYSVRYDGCNGTPNKEIEKRVPRKVIRPCPPVVEVTEDWRPGEFAEVCQNSSWTMAIVLKVLGERYILVTLLGSSLEFAVHKFDIRVRQSWLNNKWIVFGKGTSRYENGKRDDTVASRLYFTSSVEVQKTTLKTKRSFDRDYLHDKKNGNFLNSHIGSKTLKRRRHSQGELYAEPPLKLRARVAYPSTLMLPKQVDGVAVPRDIQVQGYRGNFVKSDADDEVSSSVCSCSINDCNLNRVHYPIYARLAATDDESSCHLRYEEEKKAAKIHRLELQAYRRTLKALHASGNISWELEALMTNLRLSLHISNDEHLMEIRNLISSQNSLTVK